jgi:hypothetical protein
MKKLLIVYGTVALMLFGVGVCGMLQSCSEPDYKEVDGRKVEMITPDNDRGIKYVEFDGHEYVYLRRGHSSSMCHSPKCHCLTEYKK